jgi:hypothetical protein
LHPPDSAPPPAEQLCPLCGKSHPGRPCPAPGGGTGGASAAAAAAVSFSGAGAAGKAFTDARTAAAEAGRTTLRELIVSIDHVGPGAGTELIRLLTVVPPGGLGASLTYDIDVTVVLSNPSDTAVIRYHGSPSDYAPLREALKQLLAPRQAALKASLHAAFDSPQGLSGDAVGRFAQAARDTGPTKCTIMLVTEGDQ